MLDAATCLTRRSSATLSYLHIIQHKQVFYFAFFHGTGISISRSKYTCFLFLLMPCLQYNKKHQERRIWDVFCKVLNLTTLNPPNRLLVLSMNIFCAKPPHDALNSRWLQQSFFVKKQTANFFFFPAFKLTPSARYLILGDRSTLTKISCSEKIVLIVVRWQIEPVVSFFFFAFHL